MDVDIAGAQTLTLTVRNVAPRPMTSEMKWADWGEARLLRSVPQAADESAHRETCSRAIGLARLNNPPSAAIESLPMTHFNWLVDGSIVGIYLLATMVVGIMVRKYVGKVEHFLVAGREVNVFLGIASLAATEFGVITCMYTAENGYKYGFAGARPASSWRWRCSSSALRGFASTPCAKPGS